MAALLAGLPVDVPGRRSTACAARACRQSIDAAQAIGSGEGDVFIAGGVESMTRAPFVMAEAGRRLPARRARRWTTRRSAGASPTRRWPSCTTRTRMGETAENVAEQLRRHARGSGRLRAASQQRAAAAHRGRRASTTRSCPSTVPQAQRRADRRRRATSTRGPTRRWSSWPACKPAFREGRHGDGGQLVGHQRRRGGAAGHLASARRALGLQPLARMRRSARGRRRSGRDGPRADPRRRARRCSARA